MSYLMSEESEMSNKENILIVEDDNIISEDIKRSLEKLGYRPIECVSSGEQAINRIKKTKPDLVLMDIVLRGRINGIEAATQVRLEFDIPVIFLSAYTDDITLKRAKKAKPYGYISKPYSDEELEKEIQSALKKYKKQKNKTQSEQ